MAVKIMTVFYVEYHLQRSKPLLRFSSIKDKAMLTVTFINEIIEKLAYDKNKYMEFKTLLENFLRKLSYVNFIERNSSKYNINSISQ